MRKHGAFFTDHSGQPLGRGLLWTLTVLFGVSGATCADRAFRVDGAWALVNAVLAVLAFAYIVWLWVDARRRDRSVQEEDGRGRV